MPHRCDVCGMTFQSRSHLIKHATSHTSQPQVDSAKINTCLESFSASLENDMLGLEDGFDGNVKISATSEFDEHSVRLSVDTNPDSLEAAAAEAAFAFGNHDLPEDLMGEVPIGTDGSGVVLDSTGAPITGERLALQCDICQARLKNKSSYIMHMKRHAGLLNFRCRLCPTTLRGQVRLSKHMRSVHNVDASAIPPLVLDDDGGEEDSCNSTESEESYNTGSQSFSIEGPSISGRGSVASSFEDRQRSVSVETIKCALCNEMFTDNERLQLHTQTHFVGADSTEVLREQLLKKWNKKLKRKKKKRKKESSLTLTPEPGLSESMRVKKTYSCLLCNMTFCKKKSWRIHKVNTFT